MLTVLRSKMDYTGQLDKCRAFLKNHDSGIVATSNLRGEPHASLANYLIDDHLHIYFMAREGAHKYKNITVNPPTCLVVCSDLFINTVEVKGLAYKAEDGARTNDMLGKLAAVIRQKNPGPLPILHYPGSEIFLFRLEPRTLIYADFYTSPNKEGEYFELNV